MPIGEVWLASGQSNMDIPLRGWPPGVTILNSAQGISKANYPNIRFLKVPFNTSPSPIDSINSCWLTISPKTAGNFSAMAYFYARKLHLEFNVPIGIIQSSIGGTPAEAWTSKESLTKVGDFDEKIEALNGLQSSTDSWFRRWKAQELPKSNEQWQQISFSDLAAAKPNYDGSQWTTIKLPGRFDRSNKGEFDGDIWFRKEFVLEDVSTDYLLKIGAVDDMDATYVNGQKVGGLAGEGAANVPRKMCIPKSLLRKGKNSLAIRVIDNGGAGAVTGPITITNDKGVNIL